MTSLQYLTTCMSLQCPIYLRPDQKSDTLSKTRPLIHYTVSYLSYKYLTSVYGLIDDDEKVASSKNIPNSRLEFKNHNLFYDKMAKIDNLFMTKAPLTKNQSFHK